MPGYLRFVIHETSPSSGLREGIFQAALRALRREQVAGASWDRLRSLLDWFNDHLAKPERFSRGPAGSGRGISWFKDSAKQYVQKMFEVREILREAGIQVDVITTRRPGYLLYEDDAQIVAEPFADTGA